MQTYNFTIGYLVNRTIKVAINAESVEDALDEYERGNFKITSAHDDNSTLTSLSVDCYYFDEEDK